jgi:hypothetical protein
MYVKLGVALAVVLGAAYAGYSYEHSRFMVFKAKVELAAKEQEQQVISIQKQQALVNKGIENEFQTKLRAVRNYYDGMLNTRTSSNPMPAFSISTSNADAKSAYYELAGACAETTIQTLALQQWIKEQAGIQ